MNIEQNVDILISRFENSLSKHLINNPKLSRFSEGLKYSLLPPGKFFRPNLAFFSFCDKTGLSPEELFNNETEALKNIENFCYFLEVHHVYTLLHDDMPCMDDDDLRRSKASHHKQFSEWEALLTGDAYQVLSWRYLSYIDHPNFQRLYRLATWSLGAKGLILGQYLDLSKMMKSSFEYVLKTHELKTARLIQLSIAGAALLANKDFRPIKQSWRLGYSLGLSFQFLDDLFDLEETQSSSETNHEQDIQPWINFKPQSLEVLESVLEKTDDLLKDHPYTSCYVKKYFKKNLNELQKQKTSLRVHLSDNELDRIESLLKLVCLND
ncbi:MAG: polyprenyl synthetase family protein [Bacteriovoracaceae bacterium]